MGYREPGVYLEVKNNPRGGLATNVSMIPTIIGTGASKLKKTVTMIRATGQVDTLPATSVASITHIGVVKTGVSSWEKTAVPETKKDYAFVSGQNVITWETGKGPATGTTYYVEIVYHVEDSQYEPSIFSSIDSVISKYGQDIQENESSTPVCPVSLGAQLALLQGADSSVCIIQTKGSAAADYQEALTKYAGFIPDIWRIVPMDLNTDVVATIIAHVNEMSTVEERMERSAFFGKPYSVGDTAPTDFSGASGVLKKIGDFASGISDKRISVIYPDVATKTLSDKSLRDIGAPYILAAIAGVAAVSPIQRSYTRLPIQGFIELKGVKMTRKEKNQLAEKGVMILDQESIGSNIVIRHGITTDLTSTQSRENSILEIQDYCSKVYRKALEPYIGKHNITPQVINMITGTINSTSNRLKRDGIITNDKLNAVLQDADNPDTVVISLSVLPPYPVNYIDITMILE